MFQFPSNGKVFPNNGRVEFVTGTRNSFNSLQTGRSFRTYPSANPVTVRAKIAKTKHELREDFFVIIIIKNGKNPYEHYTKHDLIEKKPLKPVPVYVHEQFWLLWQSIGKSRKFTIDVLDMSIH